MLMGMPDATATGDVFGEPPSSGWLERTRDDGGFRLDHNVLLYSRDDQTPLLRSVLLSGKGVINARGHELGWWGFLHYRLLRAPWADGSGDVYVIKIDDVTADPSGKGTASVLYRELRATHPSFVVAADQQLTDLGRIVATHYRAKYPDRHLGRLDTDLVLHRTSGPDDPIYRAPVLHPPGHQDV